MKKFLVALIAGGLPEDPDFKHCDYEIIEAKSAEEAENNYNKEHNCTFYYGSAIGEIVENVVVLRNWYKNKAISEKIDAKLYAKIEADYSSSEDYQSWFSDLIVEYDKTKEYSEAGYTLVGIYDSKEDKLKIALKNIAIVDCIANYTKKSKRKI